MFIGGTLRFEGRQKDPGVALWIENLQQNPNLSFLGVVLFIAIGYYVFYVTLIGNIKFGLRFFSL